MKTPGLSITPIKLISGDEDFCQEFFDDVRVPADHVLGEVNDGWHVASTQLAAEKAGMARGWFEGLQAAVETSEIVLSPDYGDLARSLGTAGDPLTRQLIGEAYVLDAVRTLTTRRVAIGIRNQVLPPSAGALSSLLAALSDARRTALMSGMTGPAGVAVEPGGEGPAWGLYRVTRHRIGGGTLEMQRNGVAERYLGLPRDPADLADRATPFNERKTNAPREN
jgi:alkylation response protein AidB-like acyl-CoA dehydrogenase